MRLTKARVLLAAVLLLALVGALLWKLSGPPFIEDPNLVRTTRATRAPGGGGLLQGIFWKYHELRTRLRPNPLLWSFNASPGPEASSIHGLLNQCMEASGTEYLIEKRVAGGTVMFGPTNVLNGAQWIQAVERALQNDRPQWWDSAQTNFQNENLVLLRHNKRTVLVLSPAAAEEYRAKYPHLAPVEK